MESAHHSMMKLAVITKRQNCENEETCLKSFQCQSCFIIISLF